MEIQIEDYKIKLELVQEKSQMVNHKVHEMQKYEGFLENVKEANPEDFADLISILMRYKSLVSQNLYLKERRKNFATMNDALSVELMLLEQDLATRRMDMGNRLTKQKEKLFSIQMQKIYLKQE